MLALCQQIVVNLIQGHQNVFLLVLKRDKRIYFVEYSIKRIFFFVKGCCLLWTFFPYPRVEYNNNETDSLNIHDQNLFTKDQPILNEPSQIIFTPCDNIENNVNNDHDRHSDP